MEGQHPSEERAAAALEAAGLNPYLLLGAGAVARTDYPEIGISVSRDLFALLSVEDVPVPHLPPAYREELHRLAVELARLWSLTWRGAVGEGHVEIAFGGHVPYRLGDDPDEAGLRLHDTILAVHHAHQAFRRRALNAAWRSSAIDRASAVPA